MSSETYKKRIVNLNHPEESLLSSLLYVNRHYFTISAIIPVNRTIAINGKRTGSADKNSFVKVAFLLTVTCFLVVLKQSVILAQKPGALHPVASST